MERQQDIPYQDALSPRYLTNTHRSALGANLASGFPNRLHARPISTWSSRHCSNTRAPDCRSSDHSTLRRTTCGSISGGVLMFTTSIQLHRDEALTRSLEQATT